MTEAPPGRDLRLVVPAAAAWAVAAIAIGIDALPAMAAWATTGVSLALVAVALVDSRRRSVWAAASLALLAIGAVLLSASGAAEVRKPAEFRDAAAQSRQVTVVATVTQTVHRPLGSETASADQNGGIANEITPTAENWRGAAPEPFRATVSRLAVGHNASDSALDERTFSVPVMIFGSVHGGNAAVGDTVRVSGSLIAGEPGDGAAYRIFSADDAEVVERGEGIVSAAAGMRARFLDLVGSLPGDGGSLLPGLAIGDTTLVSDDLDEAMKLSALSHLTAVSGANCAIIVALVMALGARLRWPRGLRIVTAVAVLCGFVVLVTPEPSVLRAAVMALAVLSGRFVGRGAGGLPALALAVFVLLLIDPWLARNLGFTLSVLATAGLLVLAAPLTGVLGRFLPRPIAAVIALPLAAQLACQPVIILLSPSIPVWGVVANILAAPAAPVATVVGLAACIVAGLSPPLAQLIAVLAWVPAAWIAAVATWFAGLPNSQIPWWEGVPGLAACAAVSTCALMAVLVRRRAVRSSAAMALACIAIVTAGSTAGSALRSAATTPQDWQFAACDVGQGDAMVIRSAGEVALIDTGQEPELISACLNRLGVDRIDLLVLTHFDADHVGGAETVLGRVKIVLAGPPDGQRDEALLKRFEQSGSEVLMATRGLAGNLGEHRWTVLWPPRSASPGPGNDASVVTAFTGGPACETCLTSVLLGDLGREAQLRLGALNRAELASLAPVDVVKVAHHGSRDQAATLYEQLDARVGVIGVGAGNDYGHPTADILATLRTLGTASARTDRDGLVLIAFRDGEMVLWRERGG
ncbi:competence protein ComEC [Salinibacterium hongtaonis]|uniref:Competence protein ComEC n=1 Tax=Homoserinimonas hongtaonis TaxID=2079791 RepID=A0A2U1SZ41_9MICO|nr:competence protein ComEC [Salinibacterium hongtaonis]